MKKSIKYISTFALVGAVSLIGVQGPSTKKYPTVKKPDLSSSVKKFVKSAKLVGATKAFAAGGPPSAIDSLRDSLFLVIGYPDDATYDELTGGEGPPREGLLGALDEVGDTLEAAVAAAYGSCAAIPTSGSITSAGNTITFHEPLRTIPAGFTAAGETFEKRMKIVTAEGIEFAMEYRCEDNIGFAEIVTAGDTIPNSDRKLNVIIDGQSGIYEVYMSVVSGATKYDAQYIRLEKDESASTFDLWVGSAFTRGSSDADYPNNVQARAWRAAMKGNYSTGLVSTYFAYEDESGWGANSLADLSDADVAVGAAEDNATNRDFQESTMAAELVRTGCVDFNSPDSNPASTAYCADLTPAVAPAWGLDSAKAGSIDDLITLPDVMLFD